VRNLRNKGKVVVTAVILLFVFSSYSYANDLYWENRISSILICNSIGGGAISEVTISDTIDTSASGTYKIIGSYRQANPVAGKFMNAFAELTGVFQFFVTGDRVTKGRYKVSLRKGYIKPKCLNPSADGFDF